MPQRRPHHKTAHAPCPYGATNWADCDTLASHRFGRCKAVVGKYEPEPCTRWAFDEKGWCGQHYVSLIEAEKQAERIAIQRAELDARIEGFIEWTKEHPSVWDRPGEVAAAPRRRKGPHMLTSLE